MKVYYVTWRLDWKGALFREAFRRAFARAEEVGKQDLSTIKLGPKDRLYFDDSSGGALPERLANRVIRVRLGDPEDREALRLLRAIPRPDWARLEIGVALSPPEDPIPSGQPCLKIIADESSLTSGTEPGPWTLYVPRHPELVVRALRAAAWIESSDPVARNCARAWKKNSREEKRCVAGRRLDVCAVADIRYLPFLLGLVENLREWHGDALRLHLLALDGEVEAFARSELSSILASCHRLETLWGRDAQRLRKRGVADQAYASKAALLERALGQCRGPVWYLDLDLFFFRSPAPLEEALGSERSVLLFPQWNQHLNVARFYGAFNAGMVLVRPGAERFLAWWRHLCLEHYNRDVRRGYFVDQGLLDLAPVYFPEVGIYRGGDENLASWNLRTVDRRKPPGSFHAAREDGEGYFSRKAAWDQLVVVFSRLGVERAGDVFFLNCLAGQRSSWPEARRFHFFLRLGEEILGRPWFPGPLGRELATNPGMEILLEGFQRLRALQKSWRAWRTNRRDEDDAGIALHRLAFPEVT